MNLTDTFSDPGSFFRLLVAQHFTKHEYGDRLPPTYQDDVNHPMAKQARVMVAFQMLQNLAQIEQRKMMKANPRKARQALKTVLAEQLAKRTN
jgi:hypothetical protein